MIYLFAATDKLRSTTSSAATVDVQLNYIDITTASGAVVGLGTGFKAFSSATTDDTIVGPGSSTTRSLKQGTWRNKDATLACDVTISYNANGTFYEVFKATLQPGESITYIEGIGFFVNRNAATLDKMLMVTGDVTNSTTSFADITGLTVPMLSGKRYAILATLFTTNDASTTGSRFSYNIGAAPTVSMFGVQGATTNAVATGVIATGTATARDTAIIATTTGQTAVGVHQLAGYIQPSADGTFALRCASEVAVASGLVVKAGSWMRVIQER